MIKLLILLIIAFAALLFSGLFSGAETGMYQMSWLRLRLGVEKKEFQFVTLGRALRSKTDFLITMLIGNNLTHYIITSITTLLILDYSRTKGSAEFIATLITTPVIFVFGDLIPKNIFFYSADRLMPRFSALLLGFKYIFTYLGIIPILRFLSARFNRLFSGGQKTRESTFSRIPRRHIDSIIEASQHEQIFTPVQTELVNRFTNIPNVTLRSVMTPLHKTFACPVNSTRADLTKLLKRCSHTRILVYKSNTRDIVGYVNIYHCLSDGGEFEDLSDFVNPIHQLSADTTVNQAINIMQQEEQKFVLVVRNSPVTNPKPVGIVTMKDLVEELVGELSEW
jgi:CBS domain containing-hemolysin-like protein